MCAEESAGVVQTVVRVSFHSLRYACNVFTPQLSPFREIAAEAQDYPSDLFYNLGIVSDGINAIVTHFTIAKEKPARGFEPTT